MARRSLTPLQALNDIKDKFFIKDGNNIIGDFGLYRRLEVIEIALKDYENLQLKHRSIQDAVLDDFKKLKALEIIKTHPEQLLDIIETDNYNEYLDLDYAPNQYISEKEYDLLKEVLL